MVKGNPTILENGKTEGCTYSLIPAAPGTCIYFVDQENELTLEQFNSHPKTPVLGWWVNNDEDWDIIPVVLGGLDKDWWGTHIFIWPDGRIDDGDGLTLSVEEWLEISNEYVRKRKVIPFTGGTKQ